MKLKHKIIALNMGALFFMLIILGTIITEITDSYNLRTTFRYLENQGNYSAIYIEQYALSKAPNDFEIPAVMNTSANYLAAVLQELVKCRVQIYYGDELLGDSEELTTSNETIRPEVKETFKKNKAYFISPGKNRVFYYAVPVNISNRYTYSLAFIYSLTEVDNMKSNTIRMFALTGLFISIFMMLGSTIISDRLTDPIKNLNEVTKQFSEGNLESRAAAVTRDEVGELSTTFNSMADSIKDMITKLNYEKEKQKYFFDNFTHEIRTPLTTILGYTELLWKTNDEEVRDKSLFYITSEGKRMLKMMERLLELSKLKNYSFELNKSDSNLKRLIEDACDSMQYKMKRYNTSCRLKLEDITMKVDPDLFKQVIINIVDNSIKYSKSSVIDISLKRHKGVKLEITDYGCGIDQKNLKNVFEPYYMVDQSRNSHNEGWGLGLSIVKEIVDKHGGSIEINSAPEKGTKIIITLA
ncbi:MAG TPA: HAMP domain-containing sensor histidine kinase [Clostridia bacterium]|nr:HAMP domain-containing sensor histidine kinase [Clostridia bacterium]